MTKEAITQEILEAEFQKAGIETGDKLILHSSLKSLGLVEGGAETVIRALLSVLGSRGTLMMPTFTFSLPMWHIAPYDLRHSPSQVGRVTEVFRKLPGVIRSDHPTHSVAAYGPLAGELTKHHLKSTPVGEDSPFGRFYHYGGKILMLGTRQDTNTALHLCEVVAEVPYINIPFTEGQDYEIAWRINETGEIEKVKIFQMPGCSRGFLAAEDYLRQQEVIKNLVICQARSQLLDIKQLVAAMKKKLRQDPTFLLCHDADCSICPHRRKYTLELFKEEQN